MADNYDDTEEPALRNFNRPVEYVKHVAKSTFRGALKGALIAGAIGLAMTALGGGAILGGIGALFTVIPVVGWVVGPVLATLGAAAGAGLGSTLGLGVVGAMAVAGAKIGGLIGGGAGLLNAGTAVEEEGERRIMVAERKEARNARLAALEQQREIQTSMMEQRQGMGLRPNVGFGRGVEEERGLT